MQITGNDITIKVNGITICYDDLGNGAIPILFIHGFPFDKSTWQPQMDYLRKTNRVIAYDLRGFGKTSFDHQPASMDLFADDLVKFMDALEINKAIVCGLSMGGYILLNALNRYPEKFEAIILSDTQCNADSSETRENRMTKIEEIKEWGINDFAADFIKNIFTAETLKHKTALVEKINNVIHSTSPKTIVLTLNALAQRKDTCASLKKIAVPSLIICGKEDKITPLSQSEFLLQNIPNAVMQMIDKAGHLSNEEQPATFNKHLSNFISDLVDIHTQQKVY